MAASTSRMPPRIEGEWIAYEHDFGVVRAGETVEHVFSLLNNSDSEITLYRVAPNCSCTVARIPVKVVQAGASFDIAVAYHVPSRNGDDFRRVDVEFSGARPAKYRLKIRASPRKELSIIPEEVFFGFLEKGQNAERVLQVANFSKQDFADLKFSGVPDWLSVEVASLDPHQRRETGLAPRQLWTVSLRPLTGRLSAGEHSADIQIQGSGAHVPAEAISVSLTIASPLVVSPNRFYVPKIGRHDHATASFLIRSITRPFPATPEKTAVTYVEPRRSGCTFTYKWKAVSDRTWLLSATLAPPNQGWARELIEGSISVTIPKLDGSPITIPVSVEVGH